MSTSLEVLSASEDEQRHDRAAWIVFILFLIPTASLLIAVIVLGLPAVVLFAFPLLLVVVVVLRSPVFGLYLLFGLALLIPVEPAGFPDRLLTESIPFFINLSGGGSLAVSGLGITPAEILMAITLIGLIGTLAPTREKLRGGRLVIPYLIFGVAVVIGEVNGLTHGGDFKLSLWELRPQVYGMVLFVMSSQLIRDRSQLKVLIAILLGAEVFKGGEGIYRYFVILGQNVNGSVPILGHDDSYLLSLFVLAVVIGLIWFRRPLIILLVAVSPIVITAIVVNHRRAGTGALDLEIATVMVLAYILEPRYRGWLLRVAVVALVLGGAFVVTFWNQQYGAAAEIIRPLKSLIDPNARDLSSDLYRIAETANLRATFRTSPLLGIGFGHPYYIFYPQNGVAKFDPLWNIIPHNTLLWIPMRMGIVGAVSFWSLISMAIVEAIWTARVARDKLIRGAAAFAVAAIFGVLFTGYYDIGIESYRNLIVLGVIFAVINRARQLAPQEQAADENLARVKQPQTIRVPTQTVPDGASS